MTPAQLAIARAPYPVRLGRYIFRHYSRLATPTEFGGWQIAVYAQLHDGKLTLQVMVPVERRAAAVALLAGGVDSFYATVGRRIADRHRGEIHLNFCPRCGHLCRTPKAQQCFACGHDWHPGSIRTHRLDPRRDVNASVTRASGPCE